MFEKVPDWALNENNISFSARRRIVQNVSQEYITILYTG